MTHNTHTHNTINQQDIHNQAMAMLQHHGAQFGTYMHQHRMNNEAMLHLLMEHIRRSTGTPQELNITMLSGGPPQPPGGGAGAIRVRRLRKKPTPYDEPAEAAVAASKPPPPPPPAPEAVPIIAEAPQQIQAKRQPRSRSRTRAAGPELKEALI